MKRKKLFRSLLLVFLLVLNGVTAFAAELPPAPEGTFSIVVIPDTQRYNEKYSTVTNPTFEAWTEWIAANLDQQRIVFVCHVGDIVNENTPEQWAVARRAMDKLHGKVPYGLTVGNHDMIGKSGDSSLFQEVFSTSRFTDFSWYGGCYKNPSGNSAVSGNNANSLQLFSAAGIDFVALHLECNAPDNVLAWADSMLEQYSDLPALITTHMGLGPLNRPKTPRGYFDDPKGRMQWKKCHGSRGNTPQQMWDKCFSKHRNIFMVCCGDQSRTQAMRKSSFGVQGNVIHEVLSDYGTHGLRVMRFVPEENKIEVQTWDPILGKLCESTKFVPDRDQHQFSLEFEISIPSSGGE